MTSRQSLHEDGLAHYEIELHELTYADDGNSVLRITGSTWRPVKVLRKDASPKPLTFDSLNTARSYVGRRKPGTVRIVRVKNGREREVVEAGGM